MEEKIDTRPVARFCKPARGYFYHVLVKSTGKGLCGFKPSGRRGRWAVVDVERPFFPRICPGCAKKANISPDISPDDATVRYGYGT